MGCMFTVVRTMVRLVEGPLRWLFRQLGALLLALLPLGPAAQRRRRAQKLAGGILADLHRQGFTRRVVGKKKSRKIRVRFEYPLLMTPDELWCPLDLRHLPPGVRTDDLRDEAVLRSIEDRLSTPVRMDYLANGKLCIVAGMRGSRFPEIYSINNVSIPQEAPLLTISFGLNEFGDNVLIDLPEMKHLLLAGATGGGKTTFAHTAITCLIGRHGPDDLELRLIDLKRTEFNLYRGLIGRRSGVVSAIAVDPEDAVQLLEDTYNEITRRNKQLEKIGATDISDFNRMTGQKMRRIVLICDEFAILTTDSSKIGRQTIGAWATLLMTRIASLGRSAGVCIIIATQTVNSRVLSSSIRANFENRLCFSTADWRQSQLVVESSSAVGLPDGRAILRCEGKLSEVQTCYITPQQVRLEVARIAEFGIDGGLGDREELAALVRDAKLLLDTSCQLFDGSFAREKLLGIQEVRRVITQTRFNEVAQRLEREGVLEPGGPRRPRRVARAFHGRPEMLDFLFGLAGGAPNNAKTVVAEGDKQLGKSQLLFADSTAENPATAGDTNTVYSSDDPSTRTPLQNEEKSDNEPDGSTDDIPPQFRKLFEPGEEK